MQLLEEKKAIVAQGWVGKGRQMKRTGRGGAGLWHLGRMRLDQLASGELEGMKLATSHSSHSNPHATVPYSVIAPGLCLLFRGALADLCEPRESQTADHSVQIPKYPQPLLISMQGTQRMPLSHSNASMVAVSTLLYLCWAVRSCFHAFASVQQTRNNSRPRTLPAVTASPGTASCMLWPPSAHVSGWTLGQALASTEQSESPLHVHPVCLRALHRSSARQRERVFPCTTTVVVRCTLRKLFSVAAE